MIKRLLGLSFVLLACAYLISGQQGVQKPLTNPLVELFISIPKTTFNIGETIPVRLEFRNEGYEDFFVGKDLKAGSFTDPSYTTWIFTDVSSGEVFVEGEDLSVSEWLVPRVIAEWWTAISPWHFYGTEEGRGSETNRFLHKAGHYSLKIKYTSEGGVTPVNPTPDAPSHTVWKGELYSNTVAFEIVTPNK